MAQLHDIKWDHEKIKFFWDNIEKIPFLSSSYFTEQVGTGLIRYVNNKFSISGDVLDFGAGHGYLSEKLIKKPLVKLTICDFSAQSVELVEGKLTKYSNFTKGVTLSGLPSTELQSNSFDNLFFIETIEHLLDPDLSSTLTEICRILKPGGRVIVTTPNNENLTSAKVLCAECGAYFHRFQHVRSFDQHSLVEVMKKHSFQTLHCETTDFWRHEGRVFSTLWIKSQLKRFFRKDPHLIFIGTKK